MRVSSKNLDTQKHPHDAFFRNAEWCGIIAHAAELKLKLIALTAHASTRRDIAGNGRDRSQASAILELSECTQYLFVIL